MGRGPFPGAGREGEAPEGEARAREAPQTRRRGRGAGRAAPTRSLHRGRRRGAAPLWGRGRRGRRRQPRGTRLLPRHPRPSGGRSPAEARPGARCAARRRGPPGPPAPPPSSLLPSLRPPLPGNAALGDPLGPALRRSRPRPERRGRGAALPRPRPLTPRSRGCPPAPSRACPSRLAPRPVGAAPRRRRRSVRQPALPLALGLRRPAAPPALYARGRGVTSRPRPHQGSQSRQRAI